MSFRRAIGALTVFVFVSGAGALSAATLPSSGLSVSPSQGSSGTTFSFSCSGLSSGVQYQIVLWSPGSNAINSSTIIASASGTVSFSVYSNNLYGIYYVWLINYASKEQATNRVPIDVGNIGSCTYSIQPSSQQVPSAGGSHSLSVTTAAGCSWSLESSAGWISVPSGQSSGSGSATYTTSANSGSSERTGTVTIAGVQPLAIAQAGAAAPGSSWSWMHVTPPQSPPSRSRHAMAYDEVRKQVILFGGENGQGFVLNDTWAWNGTTWVLLNPTHRPSARRYHAMAWDDANKNIVLFGGGSTAALDDTWIWNGTDWIQKQVTTRPPARLGPGLAYDHPAIGGPAVALFGGTDYTTYFDDTWHWDGAIWTNVTYGPDKFTPARSNTAYAITPSRHPIQAGGWATSARVADSWILWEDQGGNGAWANQSFPFSARTDSAATRDHWRRLGFIATTVLFGGAGNAGLLNDTLSFNGSSWGVLESATTPPSARRYHTMAYDLERQETVLFGGLDSGGSALAETWVLTGLTISKSAPSTVQSGQTLTYTLRYRNGGAAISSVRLMDRVPSGTTFVSATGGGAHSSGAITWNLGTVPFSMTGATVSYTVQVTRTSGSITDENLSDYGSYYDFHYGTYALEGADGYRTLGPPVTTAITSVPGPRIALATPKSRVGPFGEILVAGEVKLQSGVTLLLGTTLRRVAYELDGVEIGSCSGFCGIDNQVWWNASVATLGAHSLVAVATDSNGAVGRSSPLSITVRPFISGVVRIRDRASGNTWPFSSASGLVQLGATTLSLRTDGTFDSRNVVVGSEDVISQGTILGRALLNYNDYINVDTRTLVGGCPPPQGNVLARQTSKSFSATPEAGLPNDVAIELEIPIVMLHGVESCYSAAWGDWIPHLLDEGFIVFTPNHDFFYNGFAGKTKPDEAAQIVDQVGVDLSWLVPNGTVPFNMICHSEGGVVARVALDSPNVMSRQVRNIYTIGTPHSGTLNPLGSFYHLGDYEMRFFFNWVYPSFRAGQVFAIAGTGLDGDLVVWPDSSAFGILKAFLPGLPFLPPISMCSQCFASEPTYQHQFDLGHSDLHSTEAIGKVLDGVIIPHMLGALALRTAVAGSTAASGENVSPPFQPITSETFQLDPNQSVDIPVNVAPTNAALFSCTATGAKVSMQLVDPFGGILDGQSLSRNPNVRFESDEIGQRFVVRAPASGTWNVRVSGASGSATVTASAALLSTWSFTGALGQTDYSPSDSEVVFRGWFAGDMGGVSIASVVAVVDIPGAPVMFVLFDDGFHQDGTAGDRTFGAFTPRASFAPGNHAVTLRASGTVGGVPFEREARSAFSVTDGSSQFTSSFSPFPSDRDGDGINDSVGVTIGLQLSSGGSFTLTGDLFDSAGYLVDHAAVGFNSSAGPSQQSLMFDARRATCPQLGAALSLRNLALVRSTDYSVMSRYPSPVAVSVSSTGFACVSNATPGPVVTSIAPSRAFPGDTVTIAISGSGFAGSPAIQFGSYATGLTILSTSADGVVVRWTVPSAAAPGALDVVVQNDDGRQTIVVGGFTIARDVAPVVRFLYPAPGQVVSGNVTLLAEATDDIRVAQVSFFVDNAVLAVDTAYPFEAVWNAGAAASGPHSIQAVASDSSSYTSLAGLTVYRGPWRGTVMNRSFDNDLSGWDVNHAGFVTTQWASGDPGQSPRSGSARVQNEYAGTIGYVGLRQCLAAAIQPGTTYLYGGKIFIPPGQTTAGYASVGVTFFSGDSCSGGIVADSVSTTITGSWQSVQQRVSAPAGAKSAFVFLAVGKTQDGGSFSASFDDIFFTDQTLPGDVNADDSVTTSDIFYLINALFASGPQPVGSADVNHDGATTVADVFYLINYLFANGPSPIW